jgi:hypothetical protein
MYLVHTGTSLFQCFGTSFLSFLNLKGISVHIMILVFSEYILSRPWSFSGRSSPACLPAGDSCSATRIQPKHTQAALMTRPWHHPCHAFLPQALRGRLLQLAVLLHHPPPSGLLANYDIVVYDYDIRIYQYRLRYRHWVPWRWLWYCVLHDIV